ncbi:complex III assembly factor LYRM7 [Neocloeon triangulifer]|uniref:complex III assembly factor LYRM7 n=1 Tax=Neocloeon triangulifer TaxID=2078957 RepID=UPI00286F3675|nr:complex III assembly factor LYRM7 [Neocloeon triangulifer]XP_059487409.1 complex III assembly factor LYRM7 [Neocloeon triangulifer]XP_059487410.1 complex III assembly factor LYRM7 [Neocloeon triangulifer]
MSALRKEVLQHFKSLHRVSQSVFEGDAKTIAACRAKINEEYKSKKHVKNEDSVRELLKFSEEIETELRENVIQAKEKSPGNYELRITEGTTKLINYPFQEDAQLPIFKSGRRCKK